MVRDGRKGAHLTMRLRAVSEIREFEMRLLQCSEVYAAPSIGPGFSRLPSWT